MSLSNPNLVRSIVWKVPSKISSEIASPTAGDCCIPKNTSYP